VSNAIWPPLPLDEWKDTYATLHMWMQVVGKICLALTPRVNHFWNVALHVTPRGIETPTIPCGERAFALGFDFVDHQLRLASSDGQTASLPLVASPVAEMYGDIMRMVRERGFDVRVWPMPVEVPDPIRFDRDTAHSSYDREYAARFWRILVQADRVFRVFRSRFIGKCSPVHFFWGSADLAVTRFSGRRAPERPGADPITRESYSHEVISHGFWPGGGAVQTAAFYAYAAPEPAGLKHVRARPDAAFYSEELSEFILPYDAIRLSSTPDAQLLDFMQSTYDAAAEMGRWDRGRLEREHGPTPPKPGLPHLKEIGR
jgi:hypothetical protein